MLRCTKVWQLKLRFGSKSAILSRFGDVAQLSNFASRGLPD
jgi:hypothetical protein